MTNADVDRPSTWKRYETGMCTGCTAQCCSLPVELSFEDLLRLNLIASDELMASPKKIGRRLRSEGVIESVMVENRTFTLGKKPDRSCIYLVNSGCSVYERRPSVCRAFPDIGPRPGFCPSIKVLAPQQLATRA